jgi:putative heme-binding domain-containing protein
MSLPAGDAERGLIVFQTTKAACATCHPVGYKGGTLGPDLSKVGAVRTRRDLLEALVFPSLSFVRSYEPVLLTRHDGTTAYGIVTNQGSDALTLATGAATPAVRVTRKEIRDLSPGQFSLMPQGIDQILTPQELADVMAYLQSRR